MATNRAIVLFGGGRMGSALLGGWIAGGVAPAAISVIDPVPPADLVDNAARWGVSLNPDLDSTSGQTVVLAVKPQRVGELVDTIASIASCDTLLISIMAGKTLDDLARLFPAITAFVRAVPNLPAAVGRGATAAIAGAACSPIQRKIAAALLVTTGALEWLEDESLVDVVTGVSGSGPAYLFFIADCLTHAGMAMGLPAPIAERLARATISGAGEMLHVSSKSAVELRRDVTSPAGTTEAGLRVLMADATLQRLMTETVAATTRRAGELAG